MERWKNLHLKLTPKIYKCTALGSRCCTLNHFREKRYVLENSSQSMRTNHKLQQLLYPSENTRHPIFLCTSTQKSKAQISAFRCSLRLFWSTSLKQRVTFTQKNLWKDKYDVIKNSRMLWESPVNKQIASVNRTLFLTAKRLNNQAAAARTPVMPGCLSRLYYHYYKYVWATCNTSS